MQENLIIYVRLSDDCSIEINHEVPLEEEQLYGSNWLWVYAHSMQMDRKWMVGNDKWLSKEVHKTQNHPIFQSRSKKINS